MRFKSNGCFLKRKNSHKTKSARSRQLSWWWEKRLLVDDAKIDGMILSLQQLASQEDPIGQVRFSHDNGWKSVIKQLLLDYFNHLWIQTGRTVEAGGIAFKSGNKILLKGGESLLSNLKIVSLVKPWPMMLLLLGRVFELWPNWNPSFFENQRKSRFNCSPWWWKPD
jgi:gamma-glutamyl phosphate reductase